MSDISFIEESINKVERWVERHNYTGYDPFDGLSSFLRPLTFRSLFAERILQQTIRQSPVNLRPLLGVKPQESAIGRGYMAWGYLKLFSLTNNHEYRAKAVKCLDWLIENRSPQYEHYGWGNHFEYASRSGYLPKFEPTIVWSCLIGQAFLDAYEILGDEKYLKVTISICEWILNLPREVTDSGDCFSYVAFEQLSIHNSNMLGAALLARTAKFTDNKTYLQVAKGAIEYSCSQQNPDGSWFYGEESKYHWIDNFHTGYNLESLKCYLESSGDKTYEDNLQQGFAFFKKSFFEESGRPKYYHNRAYPVDIQCASQAIETLANFAEYDKSSLARAVKVALWTISNMQDKNGFFYYRLYPFGIKAKMPMIHWGDATMYKALTFLLSKINRLKLN